MIGKRFFGMLKDVCGERLCGRRDGRLFGRLCGRFIDRLGERFGLQTIVQEE